VRRTFIGLFLDMSILSRNVGNHSLTWKLNSGINQYMYYAVRTLRSTATDSTPQTMHLDSENQQEDQG